MLSLSVIAYNATWLSRRRRPHGGRPTWRVEVVASGDALGSSPTRSLKCEMLSREKNELLRRVESLTEFEKVGDGCTDGATGSCRTFRR